MTCESCGVEKKTRGAMLKGKFYPSICDDCINGEQRIAGAQAAQFQRESDQREFAKDIIQPYNGDVPNEEFIQAYPKEAENNFTQEELRKYG